MIGIAFSGPTRNMPTSHVDPNDPVLRKYFTWQDATTDCLGYGTLEDYAGRIHYEDQKGESWQKQFDRNLKAQAARFGGRFAYCEGGGGDANHVYKVGATTCLAEVGGMVRRANSIRHRTSARYGQSGRQTVGSGLYFLGPDGGTCFVPAKDNAWRLSEKVLNACAWPVGPKLGPSSAFQRRIFFHTYMSGAQTRCMKNGVARVICSTRTRRVSSSYGKVTRDLLDFQDAHDAGEPYTPIALVGGEGEASKRLFEYADADKANKARAGAGNPLEVDCYSPWRCPRYST